MKEIEFVAKSEQDTMRLGNALAQVLPPQALVALQGTLGAGKTNLTKAIAVALEVPADQVLSPTFTLCNEYQGSRPIYHLDLYRITDEDELLEIGFDEYLQKPGLTIVEWADRYDAALPAGRITVDIEVLDESTRSFLVRGETAEYETCVGELVTHLG